MNRLEIMPAMDLYRIHESKDHKNPMQSFKFSMIMSLRAEMNLPTTEFRVQKLNFLIRVCFLDFVTPTATQNRLSYLVELPIDKKKSANI